MARRRYLGSSGGTGARMRVYLTAESIEVDELDGGLTAQRRRVLLDDVLVVTYDRRRSKMLLGLCTAVFATGAVTERALPASAGNARWIILGVFTALAAIPALFHLVLGIDRIVVFGRRCSAQLEFSLRKTRARQVFAEIQGAVRAAQDATRAARAALEVGPPHAPDSSAA